jgi:hypothetical protein
MRSRLPDLATTLRAVSTVLSSNAQRVGMIGPSTVRFTFVVR